MIVVNSSTRQFNIPGADLVFGVESDSGSVVKEFQCPRYVGNNLDLTGCFIRMNYRNANGEVDSYLVSDVAVDGDNIVFGWELSPKVTMYKGNVSFVMCVVGPDTKLKWHTTLGRGQVLEGLEPDWESVMDETVDVVAQLVAMVEAQTKAVADKGSEWVRNVQAEGTDQIIAVQTAGRESREAAVAEIEAKGVNVRASIPDDYTALSEAVDGLVRSRAGAIVCSAEGSVITVNDASDMAIQGMKIFGRSTQDGTPTPDAPVEIKSVENPVVTVCGKNLLDMDLMINDQFVKNTDGTYTITKNGAGTLRFSKRAVCSIPKGTYILSVGNVVGFDDAVRVALTLANGEETACVVTANAPKTIIVDADIVKFATYIPAERDDGVYTTMSNLMLECDSEVTAYEPYKAVQTVEITHTLPGIPVSSGGNYTDTDGQQWICDEVDFEKGLYVQRIHKQNITDTSSLVKHPYANDEYFVCYLQNTPVVGVLACVSSHFERVTRASDLKTRSCIYLINASSNPLHFSVPMAIASDINGFREWAVSNGVEIFYPLATPVETPLSETEIAAYRAMHSNYPNTTILNDAGAHMVVKYAADTKLYIDNKIAALVGG